MKPKIDKLAILGISAARVSALLGTTPLPPPVPPPSARPTSAHRDLTDDEVRSLRHRVEKGEKLAALAFEFGISIPAVSRIASGLTYKHAGGPITRQKMHP